MNQNMKSQDSKFSQKSSSYTPTVKKKWLIKSVILRRLRKTLKLQEKPDRLPRLRRMWRILSSLYHYHPRERFLNLAEMRLKCLFGVWERLTISPHIIHLVFHICLRKSGARPQVVKLPAGNGQFSCNLLQELKRPGALERYTEILQGISSDPWLRSHYLEVREIRRDGGYSADFIEGINLAELRHRILGPEPAPVSFRAGLSGAIDRLVGDLRSYCAEHGRLVGDWPLHNLVYSPAAGAIVNVDAEGFFSWYGPAQENYLPIIEANLLDLKTLIKLVERPEGDDGALLEVFRVLDEVRRNGKEYSGNYFVVGYHSLTLRGRPFRGQRACSERLALVPFDFRGKVVYDLGCNVGGMLHVLADEIRLGFGVDRSRTCVNAAHLISDYNNTTNLKFFTFDLDIDYLRLLQSFLLGEKADICFLLSVCRWIKRWPEVIRAASALAETLLFESNGSAEQQEQQRVALHALYKDVRLISTSSPDDPLQGARRLYLCSQTARGAS